MSQEFFRKTLDMFTRVDESPQIGQFEEEKLDELSPATLGSYVKKASHDVGRQGYDAGEAWAKRDRGAEGKHLHQQEKRKRGISQAIDKMVGGPVDEASETSSGKFKSKEEAIRYAQEEIKTERDPLDGFEIYAAPDGTFRVNHTMNSAGRQSLLQYGAEKLGTVRRKKVDEASETIDVRKIQKIAQKLGQVVNGMFDDAWRDRDDFLHYAEQIYDGVDFITSATSRDGSDPSKITSEAESIVGLVNELMNALPYLRQKYGEKVTQVTQALQQCSGPVDEAQVNELSPKTLGKYVRGAADDITDRARRGDRFMAHATAQQDKDERKGYADLWGDEARRESNRRSGIKRATDRLALGYPERGNRWDQPIYEGNWALPDTPEKAKALAKLLSKPLHADAATHALYNYLGDDDLFDRIDNEAAWMDSEGVKDRDIRDLIIGWMQQNAGRYENSGLDKVLKLLGQPLNEVLTPQQQQQMTAASPGVAQAQTNPTQAANAFKQTAATANSAAANANQAAAGMQQAGQKIAQMQKPAAKPAAPMAQNKPTAGQYQIKPGDNLTKIAKANNTTVQAIMQANPQIKDPNRIAAGAGLNLPQATVPMAFKNGGQPAQQAPAQPQAQPAAQTNQAPGLLAQAGNAIKGAWNTMTSESTNIGDIIRIETAPGLMSKAKVVAINEGQLTVRTRSGTEYLINEAELSELSKDTLNELSKEKLAWYLKKAPSHMAKKGENMVKRDKKFKTGMNPLTRHIGGLTSRQDSIATAAKKFLDKDRNEGEMVAELSKDTLKSYAKKASRDASEWSNMKGETNPNSFANDASTERLRAKAKHFGDKTEKRQKGIDRAIDRLEEDSSNESVNNLIEIISRLVAALSKQEPYLADVGKNIEHDIIDFAHQNWNFKGRLENGLKRRLHDLEELLDETPGIGEAVGDDIVGAVFDAIYEFTSGMPVSLSEKVDLSEKSVSKKQQKFFGMVRAAQKGEKPASKAVADVAKSMSKQDVKDFASTKHKGLPKKVKNECTTSGAVATVMPGEHFKNEANMKTPKIGKGVYDKALNESMNISVNLGTDPTGKPTKSININATDEDAEQLSRILSLAGIDQIAQEPQIAIAVPAEDSIELEENMPDWPTKPETMSDTPTLSNWSGGLNKPKVTGQTTRDPINVSPKRGSFNEDVELERTLFQLYQNWKGE